jgi:predicted  nucleic acid-binding Zn-ribbon protein
MKRPPHRIQPKISTMPRQRSEAAHYLDIYKLTIEKKRLRQELVTIEQRRHRIQERLDLLEEQVATLEQGAQDLRTETSLSAPHSHIYPPAQGKQERWTKTDPKGSSSQDGAPFDLLTLDY